MSSPTLSPGLIKATQTLAGIELFKAVTPAERQELERRCRWRTYTDGEQIIDRENDSQDVFFVVSGLARVVNYSAAGREISFDEIGAGGMFGELAAIDGLPRSASVVAKTATLTASLPPAAFREIIETHPAVAQALLRRLASIVRGSTDRIMDLSTLGAHNRIYAELLRQARETDSAAFDSGAARAYIRPMPVHSDLAARVSTARETVARVLSDLTRKGILERESDALVILDVHRLSEMVKEFRGE